MTPLPPFDEQTALRIAASRAALAGTVTRWLVHELRGPVQVLTLVPDLLDPSGPPDPSSIGMLRDGAASLERITLTIDDFLQRPPAEPSLAPVAVGGLLALMARVGRAHRGDVAITADDPPTELPAMAAVEGWLPHILGSLLVNAIEACETEQRGLVRLTAAARDGRILLTVHDDGPGLAAAVAAAAFDGISTRPSQGWPRGLGLPVARLLARAMGGDVVLAHNQPGDVQMQLQLPAWPART